MIIITHHKGSGRILWARTLDGIAAIGGQMTKGGASIHLHSGEYELIKPAEAASAGGRGA